MVIKDKTIAPYQIKFDGSTYILEEPTGTTDRDSGNEIMKNHGYFSKLESAIEKVIKLKLTTKAVVTLKEFLDQYRELRDEIVKAVKP